jgi:methyl-accepting chemotaxis protein
MDTERRAQQIKDVIRVSSALRADMPQEAICALLAQTIHTTLGFRAAAVNLIVPGYRHFVIAATAGISDAERQRLVNDPPPVDHIISLMRPNFQVSRSFFISHEHKYLLEGAGGIMLLTPSTFTAPRAPNAWHPDDVFFVPLFSIRENRLLGVISLDLPEDGRIPSHESAEVIELLASQAATALDTARLLQEREQERQALEHGLDELLAHLERMRQRDFSARAQLRSTAFRQVAGALNDVSDTLGNVLADVRDAGLEVQRQSSEMRTAATLLAQSAQRQAEQIRGASEAIQLTSAEMGQIVERAAESSVIAAQAEGISNEGRETAERASAGMNAVREITSQAAKRIKKLGESSQEIGDVIQLVSDFASQTHLLALNAAIEAANAGEHGSGFAIVAREIRNLAQNSNDATKQIHARVNGIQNETNQVAITVEHATQQVGQLAELVARTGAALHAVEGVVQRMVSMIAVVHQTAAEQARATGAVSETMTTIADITDATWGSAEQMRASMDQLAELASILQTKIELFRLNERLQPGASQASQASQASYPSHVSQVSAPHPAVAAGASDGSPSSASSGPFPAVSAPGVRGAASAAPATPVAPGASLPAWSVAEAPALDPYASSAPAQPLAPRTPGSPMAPDGADMAQMATMPMSAVQAPGVAPAAPTSSIGAAAMNDGDETSGAGSGRPQLFSVNSSPLTPLRLAAMHDDAAGAAGDASGEGVVPPAEATADAGAFELPEVSEAVDLADAADAAPLEPAFTPDAATGEALVVKAGAGEASAEAADSLPVAPDGAPDEADAALLARDAEQAEQAWDSDDPGAED